MTTLHASPQTDKRQAAAVALVESHLVDIKAHQIVRRYVNDRVVWLVNGHVVTLDPVTCDCGDFQHRHPEGGCKHIRAAVALAQPAPVAPAIKWTSDTRKANKRTEREEEI